MNDGKELKKGDNDQAKRPPSLMSFVPVFRYMSAPRLSDSGMDFDEESMS